MIVERAVQRDVVEDSGGTERVAGSQPEVDEADDGRGVGRARRLREWASVLQVGELVSRKLGVDRVEQRDLVEFGESLLGASRPDGTADEDSGGGVFEGVDPAAAEIVDACPCFLEPVSSDRVVLRKPAGRR